MAHGSQSSSNDRIIKSVFPPRPLLSQDPIQGPHGVESSRLLRLLLAVAAFGASSLQAFEAFVPVTSVPQATVTGTPPPGAPTSLDALQGALTTIKCAPRPLGHLPWEPSRGPASPLFCVPRPGRPHCFLTQSPRALVIHSHWLVHVLSDCYRANTVPETLRLRSEYQRPALSPAPAAACAG